MIPFDAVSEKIKGSASGTTATVVFYCTFADAILYQQTVIPQVVTIGGTPQFRQGAPYDRIPGILCTDCDIEQAGDYDTSGGDWPTAKVTVNYGPPQEDQDQQNSATEIGTLSYDLSGEELVLPKTGVKVGSSSGDDLDSKNNCPSPIKIVPKGQINLTFKFRPQGKPSTYETLIGKVNDSSFKGFAAETLMFQGLTTNTGRSTDGTQTWSWGLKFEYQPNNWNKQFIEGSWQYVFINGNKMYEQGNFAPLLPS